MSYQKVKKVKILLPKTIAGAHKNTANHRKTRSDLREERAYALQLGFRYEGDLVRKHSIKNLLKRLGHTTTRTGICLVCAKRADSHTCEVEITKII